MSFRTHHRTRSPEQPVTPRRHLVEAHGETFSDTIQADAAGSCVRDLAAEMKQSVLEQPRVSQIQVLLVQGAAAARGLAAGLTRLLALGRGSQVQLRPRTGEPAPVAEGAPVQPLVDALLKQGTALAVRISSGSQEQMEVVAAVAMAAGRRVIHGAQRWAPTSAGWILDGGVALRPRPSALQPAEAASAIPAVPVAVEIVFRLPPTAQMQEPARVFHLPALPVTAAGLSDEHRAVAILIRRQRERGTALTDNEARWLEQLALLEAAHAIGKATSSRQAPVRSLNEDIYERSRAKKSNHETRKANLADLLALSAKRPLTPQEDRKRTRLKASIDRDGKHQWRVNAALDHAVERRTRLVLDIRRNLSADEIRLPPKPIPTSKGAIIVYPRHLDPRDQDALARWAVEGFERRRSKITSHTIDFQLTWADGVEMDRTWMTYIVRRLCIAIGRDPDLHVLAGSHEPGIHPPSKKDGRPIQPHGHVAVLTHNADGSPWRCDNMHLVLQREAEAINRERGWELTTAAAAKGAQIGWYSEGGSARMGWKIDGVFTATDSPEATRAVAREFVPSNPETRPGAGIVVINEQHSERRKRLRIQDVCRLAAASKEVDQLQAQISRAQLAQVRDATGRIRLRYVTGAIRASGELSKWQQLEAEFAHAVLRRDAAACAVILKRFDYFFR